MSINTDDYLRFKGGLLRNNLSNSIHRLKAPAWPEVGGSQECGGHSTEEYGGKMYRMLDEYGGKT